MLYPTYKRYLCHLVILLAMLCAYASASLAQPSCFKDFKQYSDGSWMNFTYNNTCAADIIIHYTLKTKKGTSKDSFFASKCSLGREQYFLGDYSFDFEVRGDLLKYCAASADQRDADPNDKNSVGGLIAGQRAKTAASVAASINSLERQQSEARAAVDAENAKRREAARLREQAERERAADEAERKVRERQAADAKAAAEAQAARDQDAKIQSERNARELATAQQWICTPPGEDPSDFCYQTCEIQRFIQSQRTGNEGSGVPCRSNCKTSSRNGMPGCMRLDDIGDRSRVIRGWNSWVKAQLSKGYNHTPLPAD